MQTEKEYNAGREISAVRCESVGEYSLPDYNGDVKKILLVKTRVLPSGSFVGEDSLEFSGSVGYDVVYIDAENTVTHAEFSTDYDAAMRINSEKYVDSDIYTAVSSCNVRLIGPRKFSVKAILDSKVSLSERRTDAIGGDAFMQYDPEYMSDVARVITMSFASGEARDVSEDILDLDGAIADEVEVLLCEVTPKVEISDKTDHGVTLKGDLWVSMLYRNGSETLMLIGRNIPYSEEIYMDGACDFDNLDARLDMMSVKGNATPTDEGVKLSVLMKVQPKVVGKGNLQIDLITDAFLKERETVNEYTDFGYTEHVCSVSDEERYEHTEAMGEDEHGTINDILYVDASVRADECENLDNSVKISGEIRFSAVACQVLEDGSTVCVPIKITAPFEQNVNTNCQIYDNMHTNCHVEARDVRMEIDGNHIVATCTLIASVSVSADRRRRCLGASYVTDEEYARDESVVTVYYPDASESLFEIAKKFHTSPRAIAESNKLTETVFAASGTPLGTFGVGKLLIK